MPIPPMTPVLIARHMTCTNPDGVTTQCSISFGVPAVYAALSTNDITMYYCPIQLSGFHEMQDKNISFGAGEDPLEALISAFCLAGPLLRSPLTPPLNEWDASTNYGFPVMPAYILDLLTEATPELLVISGTPATENGTRQE